MRIRKTADGRWIPEEEEPDMTDGSAITLNNSAVQDLIRMIVNDTMAEKDRTVTIRIDPDGAISVSIYPMIN